jgi:hypothetical protein
VLDGEWFLFSGWLLIPQFISPPLYSIEAYKPMKQTRRIFTPSPLIKTAVHVYVCMFQAHTPGLSKMAAV